MLFLKNKSKWSDFFSLTEITLVAVKKKKKKLIVESRAAAIIKGRYAVCLDEESGAYVESGTMETRELLVKC